MYNAEVPTSRHLLTNPLLWLAVFACGVGFIVAVAITQDPLLAVIIGVLLAFVSVLVAHLGASKLCDGFIGATSADPVDHAALFNATESLCLASGLRQPELKIFQDMSPAALAYGTTSPRIAVSPAFFEAFTTAEQEAVVAHLLCRVQSGDARRDTLAAVIYGTVMTLVGGRSFLSAHVATKKKKQTLLHVDLAAARLNKYPPALMSALQTMKTSHEPDLPRWLKHMLMLPPGDSDFKYRMGVLAEI